MDLRHLDDLSRFLATPTSRRRLLRLTALPVLGGLLALADDGELDAKERRRRRKTRHKQRRGATRGKRQRQQRRSACKPRSRALLCAGTCGSIKSRNSCGKTVDCGSCACDPACGVCLTCQDGPNSPGVCMVAHDQTGNVCGSASCANGVFTPAPVCGVSGCEAQAPVACAGTIPVCTANGCVACSAENPCPQGQCCAADGSCVAVCPTCQTCDSGLCTPSTTLNHACAGPCASGEWCDNGSCQSIQDTVRLPDCQSLCDASTTICGLSITCPSCFKCPSQTGCSSNLLPDGPLGNANYCSVTETLYTCTTNADCVAHPPSAYCAAPVWGTSFCATICPF